MQQVHGDDNYKIITFSHDYQTTHSKAVIQFTSNGQAGEITFQIRYYGSNYTNLALNFFFFSRVLSGKHSTSFDDALFDVDDVQLTNQILYFEDVNLNGNKIKNIAHPTEDEDGANKKYVDDEIAKLPHSDNGTLKLDGSRAMTGTLDLGGQRVVNIKGFVEDDSTQASVDAQFYDVVHWGKIHKIRADLERYINAVSYQALNRDDPDPMEDDIDMANHKIINLSDPVNNSDAVTKKCLDNETSKLLPLDGSKVMSGNLNLNGNSITNVKDPTSSDNHYAANVNYVNKTIDDKLKHSIQSSNTNNAFQYVMDDPAGQFFDEDDIRGERKTNKYFHKVNKETYEMKLLLDSIGYYSSRLGINMYVLPNGEYTLVLELYYPNSIDQSTIHIAALSSVETVSKVTTNVFSNHTRTIVHLHKYNNVAPNRLMIDMELKNKTGISYANELTIYVIVYGLSGYFNNVDTSVWDTLFEVTDNGIKFETNINLNNNEIKNIADGVENNDAVNIKQLNEMESNIGKYVQAEISKIVIPSPSPSDVYFYTRQPVYNSYAASDVVKTLSWNSITNYSFSGNDDFTLNNNSITILKSGVYRIYYHEAIVGSGTGGNSGYLVIEFDNISHKRRDSGMVDSSKLFMDVYLDFQVFVNGRDRMRIKAYNVTQFGTHNHRGASYDDIITIKK